MWDQRRLTRQTMTVREKGRATGDLAEWLRDGRDSDKDRVAELAEAVADLHRRQLYHGNLNEETVNPPVRKDGFSFDGLEHGGRMDWLPPTAQLLLRSRDLASLLAGLGAGIGSDGARRFLTCYSDAMQDSAVTQRILRYLTSMMGFWSGNTTIRSLLGRED